MISESRLEQVLGIARHSAGDLAALLAALQSRTRSSIRMQHGPTPIQLPGGLEPVPWWQDGFWVADGQRPSRSLNYLVGDYYIQDAGSMLAIAAAWSTLEADRSSSNELRICDLCAAPGGKSTAMVEWFGNRGWLLANEPVRNRAAVLEFNLSRTGASRWMVASSDPEIIAEQLPQQFDLVLVDAPCSGQTLIGRQKQVEAAWSDRQIEHSAARQQRILTAAAQMLSPGGRLVYSTCTFASLENECQVDWMEHELGLRREPNEALKPYEVDGAAGCYRLWPHRDRCAGAFAATLSKPNEFPYEELGNARRSVRGIIEGKALEWNFPDWGSLDDCFIQQRGQRMFGWPEEVPSNWLRLFHGGPEVAYQTGKSWHPGYALAMRREPHWKPERVVDLSDEQAYGLVRGQAIASSETQWMVLTWQGKPLCWGKGDGRRIRPAMPPALRAMV